MKMMKQVMICVLLISFALAVSIPVISAQEKKPELIEADKKATELMEQYATPGANHKYLDYFVGDWESLSSFFSEPAAEPITHKQEITVKWILGGRFLHAHINGNFQGMAYDGFVYTGYNNYKKEFFAIQMSTMSTGYFISTGTLDKTGKIRTETGVMEDPTAGDINVKAVTTLVDRNKYLYDFYMIDDKGKETKIMDIVYTRKN